MEVIWYPIPELYFDLIDNRLIIEQSYIPVIATYSDPIPGYCTNYFGLNGGLMLIGSGVARLGLGNTELRANIVCADFVINGTLAIIWDQVVNK